MRENVIEILIRADDKASAQLKALAGNTKSLGASMSQMGTIFMAAGAAIEGGLTAVILKTAEWAHNLEHVSERLGVSTEYLSEMEYVLKRTGGDIGELQVGLRMMSVHMVAASESTAKAREFQEKFGFSIRDTSGHLKTAERAFFDLADVVVKTTDPVKRLALMQELLGRGALALLPALSLGSAGLQNMMHRADELGGTLSGVTAKRADEFHVALVDVKTSLQGVGMELFNLYGDRLIKFGDKLSTDTIPSIKKWIDTNKQLVSGLGAAGLAMGGAGLLMKIGGAAVANPEVAAIIAAIGAIVAGIVELRSEYSQTQDVLSKPLWKMTDEDFRRYALSISATADQLARLNEVRKSGPPDAREGEDVYYARGYEYFTKQTAAIVSSVVSLDEFKRKMQEIYAMYQKPVKPIVSLIQNVSSGGSNPFDILGETRTDLAGRQYRVQIPVEFVPAFKTGGEEIKKTLAEFDVSGVDIARDLTQTFGGAFSGIAQKGWSAASAFEQAWESAIGNIASKLAEKMIWKVGSSIVGAATGGGSSILSSILSIFGLASGGEFIGARSGLEVSGGSIGRDTVHSMLARGEIVMPSPTVNRLKDFLDRAESGQGGRTLTVNPLFFSGSREDSFRAADWIRRRLDMESRFVLEGGL